MLLTHAGPSFPNIRNSLLDSVAFTYTTRKRGDINSVSTFIAGFQHYIEFHSYHAPYYQGTISPYDITLPEAKDPQYRQSRPD